MKNTHRHEKFVGDPSTERRPDRRRRDHRHAVERESSAEFFFRESIDQIACSTGARPPPPSPCRTRNKISVERLGAMPHRNEGSQ